MCWAQVTQGAVNSNVGICACHSSSSSSVLVDQSWYLSAHSRRRSSMLSYRGYPLPLVGDPANCQCRPSFSERQCSGVSGSASRWSTNSQYTPRDDPKLLFTRPHLNPHTRATFSQGGVAISNTNCIASVMPFSLAYLTPPSMSEATTAHGEKAPSGCDLEYPAGIRQRRSRRR
jgi:hypothetical protein